MYRIHCEEVNIGYIVGFSNLDRETETLLFTDYPELQAKEIVLTKSNPDMGLAIQQEAINEIVRTIYSVIKDQPQCAFYYLCQEDGSHTLGRLFNQWYSSQGSSSGIVLYTCEFDYLEKKFSGGLLLINGFQDQDKLGNYFVNLQAEINKDN